jgi:hypothetical protein
MKFDLSDPCMECPFRAGASSQRIVTDAKQLRDVLKDKTGRYTQTCHTYTNQYCVGAALSRQKRGLSSRVLDMAKPECLKSKVRVI